MPPKRRQGKFQRTKAKRSRLGLLTALFLLILVGCYVAVLDYSRPHVTGDRLRFNTFVESVKAGRIDNAVILDEDAYVVGSYRPGLTEQAGTTPASEGPEAPLLGVRSYNAPLVRGTQGQMLQLLVDSSVQTDINQQVGKRVAALASVMLPGLIVVVLFLYLILSHRRGAGLFGMRSGARKITAEQGGVTFADVAGQDAAVTELKEIKQFLADPERFAELGAVVPKGVLLFGPPGCGKTLLARALAGEAGANFYSISGSDFIEVYVGVGASRVRDLFKEARENAPSLIFIDELDSIGRARGVVGTVASHGEQEQALNQILAEMDGFSPSEGIIVIGATNRADILDQALLRPGRFDRTVGLERPDEKARLTILELHANGKRLEEGVDLAAIARKAIGMTGADLASVMNEGALLAARTDKATISQAELDQAVQRILEAPERQRRLSTRERSIGKRFSSEQRVTFADVAGVGDAIQELSEVKEYLATPERFEKLGARVPRGILLSGPPGCGKTLLARAVAGEANAAFISVAGSEFVEVFVGEGASRVRELFAEARSTAPAIIFIDEIDAIGGRRSTVSFGGSREADQTLNQILVELDGFEPRSGMIIMGATNRPDMLDSALVRPGRFDRRIEITMPDRAGRLEILKLHAKAKPLGDDVNLENVAGLTRGFSGADLANMMNEAALLASRRGLEEIPMSVVDEAMDRAMLGVGSSAILMSEEERWATAVHEAGHALVALALPGATPPHKLTIVPRGGTLGHCQMLDAHDRVSFPRSALIDHMAVSLGGRVAEQLALGEPHTGASTDLAMARRIARQMVCDEAMTDALGLIAYPDERDGGGQRSGAPPYSEEAARTIDAEIRALIHEASERARAILSAGDALARVAHDLLEKETLSANELEALARPGTGPAAGDEVKSVATA